MPGSNPECQASNTLLIEYLDTGSPQEYPSNNANHVTYTNYLLKRQWEQLQVRDSSFFKAQPTCGFSVQDTSRVYMFGGQSVQQFTFCQQEVN